MHVFPSHNTNCPWCVLENQGLVLFLDLQAVVSPSGYTNFVLSRVWASIEAQAAPQPVKMPTVNNVLITPKPIPLNLQGKGSAVLWRTIIVVIAIGLISITKKEIGWLFITGIAWWAWVAVKDVGSKEKERDAERKRRLGIRDQAKYEFEKLVSTVQAEVGPEKFLNKKKEFSLLKEEYLKLPELEKIELNKLINSAEARQKQKFLERFFIDSSDIFGVGQAKKAALRSFGIETAADVSWHSVHRVKGFGDVLTRSVVDWKNSCERKFVFNPSLAITDADKQAVKAKIAKRKLLIETRLSGGAEELRRIYADSISKAGVRTNLLNTAFMALAQVDADYNLIK